MVTYEEVILSLRNKQYAPAYILCGEESFYIDKASDYIETHVLDEIAREFDLSIIYGKDLPDANVAPVVSAARGFAMMGGYKVIIVKEAQNIKYWDALALYMEHPQTSTILVFCYKYGTPDMRISVFKNFETQGGVIMKSNRLYDNQIEKWIRNYVAQRNEELKTKGDSVQIDDKITKILADNIGADLKQIEGALQKLIDGRPKGTTIIDADLVERNIGISKDFNVFELQNALIKGDVVKANQITQYFATSKGHPMTKELGILYNFFANLMIYHYLPDKSDFAVAKELKISTFFAKDYTAAARRFSAGKTFSIIGYFRDTDARLKGLNNSSAKEEDIWKELIYKILH